MQLQQMYRSVQTPLQLKQEQLFLTQYSMAQKEVYIFQTIFITRMQAMSKTPLQWNLTRTLLWRYHIIL